MAEMASDIKARRTGEVSASADELFQFINKARLWFRVWGFGFLVVSPRCLPGQHKPSHSAKGSLDDLPAIPQRSPDVSHPARPPRCARAPRWTPRRWSSLPACSTTS
jgi:hypothetical protein